jgi:tRNA dimethylallyltransferase
MAGQPQPCSPVFLAGPTASGKSEVALLLAEILAGEIISMDSMQVYRGLDIGTAKPSTAERKRVPHHLIDVMAPSESFDAAKFLTLAKQALTAIQSRNRRPVCCGGTGLYFKVLLEGLGEAPPPDASLREEIEAAPISDLLTELAQGDPATFAKIDRQNRRRVIRAVEVIRLTGRPFSRQRSSWNDSSLNSVSRDLFGLSRHPEDLRQRIEERVDTMFARGLIAETRRLLELGLEQNRTAMQAIGYRQVVEHLRGERSLPETIELVKSRTRQFAKRQMTWFRHQLAIQWINVGPDEPSRAVADRIRTALKSSVATRA